MKYVRIFLSENFQFLEVKFYIYLERHVFVMRGYIFTRSGSFRCFASLGPVVQRFVILTSSLVEKKI